MATSTAAAAHDSFTLYATPEKYVIEPANGPPSETLVIDRVSKEIGLLTKPDIPPNTVSRVIYGVVGVIHLLSGPYLIVITERREVGQLNGQTIWRIKATEAYSYTRNSLHLTDEQNQYNKQYIAMVQLVLSTPNFYYSTTYDISHTLQRLQNTTPDFLQMGLMERADQRFVWNHHLVSDFINQPELRKFCVPIIHGFVYITPCTLKGNTFTFALVSRRSCYRAGTRMFMRGVDDEGHAANFVETEQIVEYKGSCSSFVQTRGSIPLFWSQLPDLRYKPPPTLTGGHDHLEGFRKHIDTQLYSYGKVVLISLIDQKGPENALGKALQEVVTVTSNNNVKYEPFDFHRECRKMRWDRLSILMDRIIPVQDNLGYFMRLQDGSVPCLQDGVFRTNCIDCLDRTNVVQFLLAKRSLQEQLQRLGVLHARENIDSFPGFESMYKNVWADNGDMCSVQYAGTGALKTDFTRTGKRTFMGVLKDGYNSAVRYVKNNFQDGFRQDAIDLFLGNYRVQDSEGVSVPCPLAVHRDIKFFALPIFLSLAFAFCSMSVLIPSAYTMENFMYFLFWLFMIALTLVAILHYGTEFVDYPKLRDLRQNRKSD